MSESFSFLQKDMNQVVFYIVLVLCLREMFAMEPAKLNSISSIVESVFAEKPLNLVYDDGFSEREMMNQVLRAASNVIVQVETLEGIKETTDKRQNVIIFIEKFSSIQAFADLISDKLFSFDGKFLIVNFSVNENHFSEIFRQFWEKFIYNVGILDLSATNNITFKTFLPFGSEKCYDIESKTIDVFDIETCEWRMKSFFPKKFQNFNNCAIKLATFEYAPAVTMKRLANGTTTLTGSDVEFITGLSTVLNFKLDIHFVDEDDGWGVLYPNGTTTGAQTLLKENKIDVLFGFLYLTYLKALSQAHSAPYAMVPLGVVIPPARLFTPLEKLLIPFEPKVWVALSIVLLIAILIIALAEFKVKKLKTLIVGNEIKAPVMEMLNALFGGSSHSLPRKHFPRILLMIFLLFCLVMRTVFQSGLFKYMQSDKTAREITSIGQLIDEEFKVYSYPALEPLLKDIKLSQK